jgi:hypothetical protein
MESETVSHALGIDDTRNQKLVWMIDEIMNTECPKADAFKKISALDITNDERVYLGYMLCKRIVVVKTPSPLLSMLEKIYQL